MICLGNWTSPDVSGDCPPPCVDFSFNCVDGKKAVLFGGYRPESGASSGAYVLNMDTWVSQSIKVSRSNIQSNLNIQSKYPVQINILRFNLASN